ncbi:MAG: hypothetical protein ACLFTY_03920 [Candidatus Aenigmatarchaeota archaeon]
MVSKTRANLFWILGTIFLFTGMRLAVEADRTIIGATDARYYAALILSFALILAGGLLWIVVGGALGSE